MINDEDRALIQRVDQGLRANKGLQDMADEEDIPLSTLYLKVTRLGYRIGKRLVPINAPEISDIDVAEQNAA